MKKISLEINNLLPAYRQIVDQLAMQVENGSLSEGEKLPPERELAESLSLARGTVKKAYDELARRGLIEASQGKGSFVRSKVSTRPQPPPSAPEEGRKEKALALIDQTLNQLSQYRFSWQEIRSWIDLRILEREGMQNDLSVAVVDCNPEALACYEKQFAALPGIRVVPMLLPNLAEGHEGAHRLAPFDLIITTTTHQHEMVARYPRLKEKIIPVAVSPTKESAKRLARLLPTQRLGVVCESRRFFEIIVHQLQGCDIPAGQISRLGYDELDRLETFIRPLDVVLVPAGYSLQRRREHLPVLQEFTERGGTVLPFDYQIERGSMLHVEERIRSLLNSGKPV